MAEELASVQEIVDLTPEGALNRAKTFLVGKGYREVKRSGNSLTVERSHPDPRLKGSVLNLWIAAFPQPGGGVRIIVRGNDRAGVQDQQSDWIEWANRLPKKASVNKVEGPISQVQEPQRPSEDQESNSLTSEKVEEYFYSPSQLASLVSVSVNKMIYAGKLPMEVIEGKYWIPEDIADDLIRKHPRRKPKGPKPQPRRFVVSKKVQTSTTQESSEADVPESLGSRVSENDYFTPEQIAHALQRTTEDVDRVIGWGEIKTTTIEGRHWISQEEVEKIISKRLKSRQDKIRKRLPTPRRFRTDHNENSSKLEANPTSSETASDSTPQETKGQETTEQQVVIEFSERVVMEAAQRMGTSINRVRQMLAEGKLVLDSSSGRLVRAKLDYDNRQNKEPQSVVSTPEAMLRIEREEKERLAQELEHEREKHEKTNLDAQQEISQLDAEITTLRSDLEAEWAQTTENARRAEEFQAELAKERTRRLAAEKLAIVNVSGSESKTRNEYDQQLAAIRLQIADMQREYTAEIKILEDDLEEERTKRVQSERRADTLEDELLTPKTSWQSDRELELEHELALESEGRKQDTLDAQYEIDQLNAELDNIRRDGGQSLSLREELAEEKSKRLNSEERLADLMSKLENNEAKRKDLERALSMLQKKILQLEEEARVMSEVRRLLSAESQVQITATEDTDPPKPSHADDPSQQNFLLKTPFGQSAFRPPFPLTDREIELLRLVAREGEITAEQIRKRKGRRAVEDLNELLDRLEIEGMNPIKEINDRYSFHPDNLPSE